MTAAVIGAIVAPRPMPMRQVDREQDHPVGRGRREQHPEQDAARHRRAAARYVIGARDPCVDAYLPAFGAVTMIASVIGRNPAPALNGE